jgi:disulfide bond formation protein DsbB
MNLLTETLDYAPRRVFALISLLCVAMLGYGMVLQHVVGLEPCPMCIVQRYALVLLALVAALAACARRSGWHRAGALLLVVFGLAGAGVAARQSWLQWYPPEVASCGRDLWGMIDTFPLERVFPMVFRGSGDCSKIDWTFLGGTIANWAFAWFMVVALLAGWMLVRHVRRG